MRDNPHGVIPGDCGKWILKGLMSFFYNTLALGNIENASNMFNAYLSTKLFKAGTCISWAIVCLEDLRLWHSHQAGENIADNMFGGLDGSLSA